MEQTLNRPRRKTDFTEHQREAVEQSRRLLKQAGFRGEEVRIWCGWKQEDEPAALRIAEALKAGEDPRVISRREDVSLSWIRKIRVRVIGRIGRGTLPP